MEINHERRQESKYWALATAAILVTAFVLVQPTMQEANAISASAFPQWDNCDLFQASTLPAILGDLQQQNSVKKGNIVKTIHAEKEIFNCFLDQGNLPVVVEVTTYAEMFENINTREVIATTSLVITCLKAGNTATVIGCLNYKPATQPVPVGSNCFGFNSVGIPTDPTEMDTVIKGSVAKTIETQKQVYLCQLDANTLKKVDIVLYTEIYEDMDTHEILEVQNHQMRCVVLITDDLIIEPDDDRRDATVESCIFSEVVTASE